MSSLAELPAMSLPGAKAQDMSGGAVRNSS